MSGTRQECLDRYRARAPKRRQLAQQILDGKRSMDPSWPQWVRYDLTAEMTQIVLERDAAKAAFDADQKRRQRLSEDL